MKRSFGSAVGNLKRDGARAADALGEAAGDVADRVTGDSAPAAPSETPAPAAARREPAPQDTRPQDSSQ